MSPYLEALQGDSDTPADSDPLLQDSPPHSPNQQQHQVPRQRQQRQQQGGVAGSRVQVVHTGALLPGLTAAAARAAQQLGAAGAGGTGAAVRDAQDRSRPPVVNLLEGSDSEDEIAPLWQRLQQSQAGQQTSRASQHSKGAPAPPQQQQQLSPPPPPGRSSRSEGPRLDDSEGSPAKRGRMTGPWEPAGQHQGSPLAAPPQGLQAGYAALLEDVGGLQGGSHRAGQLAVPAGAALQQRRVRGLFKESARNSQQQQQDLEQEQEKAEGEEGDGWRVVVGSQGQDVILLT